ncbi:hypothetical protein [Mastigocladopsis repens]|uniref:hypothetical protein n=1 Tax=Mastigocladopsis repens TaxID=221287 RepID=UPI000362F0AF|nr:hypothetical protein [Mastigocladopsis repens]
MIETPNPNEPPLKSKVLAYFQKIPRNVWILGFVSLSWMSQEDSRYRLRLNGEMNCDQ